MELAAATAVISGLTKV